jgi:hypothetical protein
MKIKITIILFISLLLFFSCVTIKGLSSQKIRIASMLSCSNDKLDIELSTNILNGTITLSDLPLESNVWGKYSIKDEDILKLRIDSRQWNEDDYSLEIAAIASYFAYIIYNLNEKDVEEKALEHAINSFGSIKRNNNLNKRGFRFSYKQGATDFLRKHENEPSIDGVFLFTYKK